MKDLQRANFNSCLETRVPFVALFVIDANRKLFYIDPLSGTYSLLSNKMVETIHVIGQDGIFQHSTNASYEEMNVCAYNDVLVVKYYCTESRKPPSRPVDVALLISLVIGVTDTDTIPENISMVAYNNFISLLVPVSHYEDEFVTALSSIANGIFRINKQYHSLSVSNKLENNRVTSSKQTICERSTHFAVVMSCLHHYQRSVDVNNNDFKAVPFGVSDKHNMKVLYDTRYHVEDNEIYSVVTSNLNRNTDSITNGTMRTNSADATQANNFCSINFSKEKVPVVRNSVHSPTSKDNKFSLDTYERRFPLPEIVLFAMTTDAINYAKAHSNSGQMLLQLLEETMKTFIEKTNFSDVKTQLNYRLFMSFLYRCDAEFQLELVSRLGRKLEPTVSKKVFPVPTVALNSIENRFTAKIKLSSVLSLFEKSLMDKNVDHATRLLTLACESVGGTETHHSTVASLFLSWELFLHCVTTMSLNNSLECFEFCCRLESLIIVHCGYVFARDSPVAATKHSIDKYIQEVAGQASSAIEIVRDGKQINSPVKCNENIAKSPNGREPNNVAPTANKSLPLYVGEGIAWIFSQTINTFIDTEDDNKVSEISTRRSTADERTRLSITDQSERSGTINSEQPGYLAREWLMLTIGKVKFDLLLCGIPLSCSDAINRSLKSFYFPNTSSNFGANYGWMPFYESPSIVLLSVLLEDLLESHSYYSAAVVLLTMLRSRSVFELIREQLYEKLRLQLVEVSMDQTGRSMQPRIAEVFNRLIHAFRLHKSVRNDQELLQNRLDQPLQVQYIRRVIESERNSKYYKDFATETESVSTIVNNISSGIAVEEKVGELLTEEQLAIEALIRKINSQNKVHNYYELPEDFLTTTCLRKSHTDSKHVSNGSVDSDTKLCTRDFLKVTAIAFLLSSTNNYVIAGSIMELMEPVKYLQLSTAGNERIDQIVEFFMPN